MPMKASINIYRLLIMLGIMAILLTIALGRITIDTDIMHTLPTDDPVIADGLHLFDENPVKDRIAIDIGAVRPDTDRLIAAAELVERRLKDSPLFDRVGNPPMQEGLSDLADQVTGHLPALFDTDDLTQRVTPLLTDQAIHQALTRTREALFQLDGIGQAAAMATDPLGLRHLIMGQLGALNPAPGATIHRGRILSADRRHLLVLATPAGSGTDTAVARPLTHFFQGLDEELKHNLGDGITLTPTGAYRAALDNETIVKTDVHRAILWATIGIAILLLATFSRPLEGLMALLPALAGAVMAFFIFALVRDSISIMVLGFGGAIISITVDHGIAYMLFVDRGDANGRRQASREIRAVGLLAVITSMGAFGALAFSGFTVFAQLGWFTAMGIGWAFLCVHTVLPRLLADGCRDPMPQKRWFSRLVERLASTGKAGLALAVVTAAVLAIFIRPQFDTDLKAMNTIAPATRSADRLMSEVWGDIFSSVYTLTEADSLVALRANNDRLQDLLDADAQAGRIQRPVTSAVFYPGMARGNQNLAAWKRFWSPDRRRMVTAALSREGTALGFAPDAFAPFIESLTAAAFDPGVIPLSVRPLLGITGDDGEGHWRQITRITPHEHFDGDHFFARLSEVATVFDPALFAQRMGRLLFDTFIKLLLIIGVSLVVVLTIFFADAGLLLTALLPLVFAFVCTLGTLGIMGRPLDIPALMLSVVILGLGVDYTLLMVRGYQRYRRFDHPHFSVVRTAVCMAASSTLVGFAVLLGAEHDLLKSAGWISFCGIGYCLVGAFLILPPLLKHRFERPLADAGNIDRRYADMEPYPRLFARYKRRLDPLFAELPALLPERTEPATILDVGCGYGVPACWLADRYPDAVVYGIEPEPERVRVAALALGSRAQIVVGAAPALPASSQPLDLVTMLDMSHLLTDGELRQTLNGIHRRLDSGGRLIMRSVLPPAARPHWTWHLEHVKLKIKGCQASYRDAQAVAEILADCRFEVLISHTSGRRQDMHWHVTRVE